MNRYVIAAFSLVSVVGLVACDITIDIGDPNGETETGAFDTGDAGDTGYYDTGDTGAYDTGDTGYYDTGAYDTGDTGYYDTGAYDTGDTGYYDTGNAGSLFPPEVQEIFDTSCAVPGCHASGYVLPELTGDVEIVGVFGSGGLLVDPGSPETSILYNRITGVGSLSRMPLGGELPVDEIQTIEDWIDSL